MCTGNPCISDLRFPVSRLLGLLAAGESREQILRAYPYLEPADIDEALRYAASLAEDETIEQDLRSLERRGLVQGDRSEDRDLENRPSSCGEF